MASWRENASPHAQQTLDELLNVALGFAQQQLAKHGEFFPYAAAIELDGKPELVASRPEHGGEQPAGLDVIGACISALTDKRDQIQAAAVVADVRTADGDAIKVDLEHVDGQALSVLLPYRKANAGQPVEYGQIRAQAGHPQIWTDS
jgi:hypothetical protein